jgi:hypothetical protein
MSKFVAGPTVATKPNWSAAVSAAVGAAVSTLLYFWAKVDVGWVVAFTVPISYAYHWLINEGEKKFPWLSVFFLALPSNLPTPVAPPVTPPATSTFVETPNGVWAADVNALDKAEEVSKAPLPPVTSSKPAAKPKATPKSKR